MDADYPCSHSMDTTWFAVDRAGHVGMFDTGENGHAPEGVEDSDLLGQLEQLRPPPASHRRRFPSYQKIAEHLGLFFYSYEDEDDGGEALIDLGVYRLVCSPKAPLHVDQLPPALRKQCKQFAFDRIDFAQTDLVQPLEQFRCVYWYDDARVAYLCGDGKTVRPIPGKEDRFAEFCRAFRAAAPTRAAELVFDGPQETAPKPRRRRKEKGDGR
jgi:hypothetical protein